LGFKQDGDKWAPRGRIAEPGESSNCVPIKWLLEQHTIVRGRRRRIPAAYEEGAQRSWEVSSGVIDKDLATELTGPRTGRGRPTSC